MKILTLLTYLSLVSAVDTYAQTPSSNSGTSSSSGQISTVPVESPAPPEGVTLLAFLFKLDQAHRFDLSGPKTPAALYTVASVDPSLAKSRFVKEQVLNLLQEWSRSSAVSQKASGEIQALRNKPVDNKDNQPKGVMVTEKSRDGNPLHTRTIKITSNRPFVPKSMKQQMKVAEKDAERITKEAAAKDAFEKKMDALQEFARTPAGQQITIAEDSKLLLLLEK